MCRGESCTASLRRELRMAAWKPQETGVQQICYLLAEFQKPGTNQAQVSYC